MIFVTLFNRRPPGALREPCYTILQNNLNIRVFIGMQRTYLCIWYVTGKLNLLKLFYSQTGLSISHSSSSLRIFEIPGTRAMA